VVIRRGGLSARPK